MDRWWIKKTFFFKNFECLLVRTRNLLPNYFKLKSRILICALQKHRLAWTHLFLYRSAFIMHTGHTSHMIKHISQRRPLDPAIRLVGDNERPKFKPRVVHCVLTSQGKTFHSNNVMIHPRV